MWGCSMERMSKRRSLGCPVNDWLDSQGLDVKQLSILAGVGYTEAYMCLTGYNKVLPQRFWKAIAARSGDVVADTVAEAFRVWRQQLAGTIGKVVA